MSNITQLPRWVLLYHQSGPGLGRPSHWDLLIQNGDLLDAWAFDSNPLEHSPCDGICLKSHRLKYLEFEGDLSDNRGAVARISEGNVLSADRSPDGCGTFELELDSIPAQPIHLEISPLNPSTHPLAPGDPVRIQILT